MSWREYLFGDASHLGGIAIKTGALAKRWRPGRRSTEIKRSKALRQAQSTAIVDQFAKARAALKKAGQTGITIKPGAVKPGTNVAITPARPPGAPSTVPRGVYTGAVRPLPTTPVRRPGVLTGALHGFLAGLTDHFGDGMGDGGIVVAPGGPAAPPGSGGVVIDPVTGLPLPPGWGVDPTTGNLIPPGDPAPLTNPNGTPYTGNAQVWVSQTPVQMFWDPRGVVDPQDTGAVKPFQDPCLYPDGAPIVGQVWLPKLNLESMNPDVFRPFTRAAVVTDDTPAITWPRTDGVDYFHVGRGESYPNQVGRPGYRYKGTHAVDGNLYRQGLSSQARLPWGPVEPWGPLAQMENKKGGGNNVVYYMQAAFDWSGNDPTTAAYPFLYDWMFDDFIQWKVMPADLWLSTGVPISSMTSGVYLPYQPSPLLHNLDFLDSLATGNHGMPQVLNWTTGLLDFDTLAAWCNQNGEKWARLGAVISQAKQRPFLVATIYDVTEVQVAPGVNGTNPVGPLPTPPLTPAPPLVDQYGSPYPIDPVSGLPYDPATGQLLDPATGLPVPGTQPVNTGSGYPGYPGDPYGGGYPGYPGDPYGGGGYGPMPGVADWGDPYSTGYNDPNGPQFVPNDGGGMVDYGDGGYAYPGDPAPPAPVDPSMQQQLQQMQLMMQQMMQQQGGGGGQLPPVMPPFVDQFDFIDQPMDDYAAQDYADFVDPELVGDDYS
jgi:hypothetical protein